MKNNKVIKLKDDDIEILVSGGRGEYDAVAFLGLATSAISAPIACGKLISYAVKRSKLKKAINGGDFEAAGGLNKAAKKSGIGALVASVFAVGGLATMFVAAEASNTPYTRKQWEIMFRDGSK